jgi:hypothetical protein
MTPGLSKTAISCLACAFFNFATSLYERKNDELASAMLVAFTKLDVINFDSETLLRLLESLAILQVIKKSPNGAGITKLLANHPDEKVASLARSIQ